MMRVALSEKSRNAKTGPIPVSTTAKASCPDSCPLKAGGCYAMAGPLGMFWAKVSDGRAGGSWDDFTARVAAMPAGTLWRHNQAGDLPGDGRAIDGAALRALVKANRGKRGFTYTHYAPAGNNGRAIAAANRAGFTVNLSGNSPAHADSLAETGAGPVVCVLPADMNRHATRGGQWLESLADYRARIGKPRTPAGRAIVVCPATYRDDVSCKTCGLCQRQREAIVGFPAHGVSAKRADKIAREA